jgi:PadR family transcriptional regulator PadR
VNFDSNRSLRSADNLSVDYTRQYFHLELVKVDAEAINRKFQKELNAGAGSLVILGLLECSGRAMYGYEIAKQLEVQAEGALPMNQGALYPALRSLERSGLLASDVEPSVSGPPRRYYRITTLGQQALVDWREAWTRTKHFVDSVLKDTYGHNQRSTAPDHREVSDGARGQAAADTGSRPRGGIGRRPGVLAE